MGPQSRKRAPVPAAYSLKPDGFWSKGSGPWSLFPVRIGTPLQSVQLLPSTSHHAYWVISPDSCGEEGPCGAAEGSQFNGTLSTTLNTGIDLRILPLKAEFPLGYNGTGSYGYDNNSYLGNQESGGPQLPMQGVTQFNEKSLFPGLLGLTTESTTAFSHKISSAISTLQSTGVIPSLTYGYTAGSYARGFQGSLTFGGYDTNRILSSTENITVAMSQDDPNRALFTALTSINIGGTQAMGSDPLNMLIDSTVQELWLPQDVCTALVNKYGLQHDPVADVYTNNPDPTKRPSTESMTLTFGGIKGTPSVKITMPFSSLDLWDATSGNNLTIFPLKTALNPAQFTLGRAFLQDAYIITDYDRQTFQLSQAKDAGPDDLNLVTIQPPPSNSSASLLPDPNAPDPNASSGLSKGAIAGIAVGSVVGGLLLLALALYIFFWRPRQKRKAAAANSDGERKESHHSEQTLVHMVEADGATKPVESPDTSPATELPTQVNLSQLPDNKRQVHEMFQLPVEMEGDFVQNHLKKPVS